MEDPVPKAVLSGVAIVLAAALLTPVAPARAASASQLTGAAFSKLARSGGAALVGVQVGGDVDLENAAVKRLSCRDCQFGGDLIARGATFEKTVDLSGSIIDGKVDLSSSTFRGDLLAGGATFNGIVNLGGAQIARDLVLAEARFQAPVLLGVPSALTGVQTSIGGQADFSVASFSGLATFEKAVFSNQIDFTLARFENDAVFSRANALRDAMFARAIFHGNADFSEFRFHGQATFDGAQFERGADFSVASFMRRVIFDRARFGEGATYLGATFPVQYPPPDAEDSFWSIQANGDVSFAFATFSRPANFENVVATGTISFNGATFPGAKGLTFSHISAGSFEMDVDSALAAVKHDSGTDHRPEVLELIESSAKARDDLGPANDAHYERQVILSRNYSPPVRVLDVVFYRAIAGYFVRPLHPLAVLLGLAAAFTLVRIHRARRRTPATDAGKPGAGERDEGPGPAGRAWGVGQRVRRALSSVRDFATSLLVTLTLIAPARKDSQEVRQGREIEIWIYRILLACTLIGFANSNPTLREMFDAIR